MTAVVFLIRYGPRLLCDKVIVSVVLMSSWLYKDIKMAKHMDEFAHDLLPMNKT